MAPQKIKVESDKLYLKWNDGTENIITLKYLRDECPCANCKGETILLKTYRPRQLNIASTEMYKIENIQLVGEYGIQLFWKDGHNTGIYSWDYLYKLAQDENSGQPQDYNKLI
jgi:DUF971 family protein